MELSMESVLETIETENEQLHESLSDLKAENDHLTEKVSLIEKALDKEKKFHRKYVDEVVATEAIRMEDFNKERRTMTDENKQLVRENRQLKKDVEFYKKANEELSKDDGSGLAICSKSTKHILEKPTFSTESGESSPIENKKIILLGECTHKSSKVLSKVNDKLFDENKKLKSKISSLNANVAVLKRKLKQMENFREKIDNKKKKFFADSEELNRLIASTETKVKHTYNQSVLDKILPLVTHE